MWCQAAGGKARVQGQLLSRGALAPVQNRRGPPRAVDIRLWREIERMLVARYGSRIACGSECGEVACAAYSTETAE